MNEAHQQLTIDQELTAYGGWRKNVLPGGRIIWAPNQFIRDQHSALVQELEDLNIQMPYATGSVRGGNVFKNAQPHAANRYFYQLDLENAYGQVDTQVLAGRLVEGGLAGTTEETTTRLDQFFRPPQGAGLAQGGPASPLLFNLYCRELDNELAAFCDIHGITYTRYLDDLTFSSPDTGFPTRDVISKDKRQVIRGIIGHHNLNINAKKSAVKDLKTDPIIVTGVQINTGGKMQLETRFLRAARAQLKSLAEVDVTAAVHYATGLNGLMRVVADRSRRQSRDEKLLTRDVIKVLVEYGSGAPF